MFKHDVFIVGGGLAGCRAALEIKKQNPALDVALVAKTHPIRSHSVAAQGGIAASLKNVDPDDGWKAHAFDTVKGSDYLADQDAVEYLTKEAPEVIIELEHLGVLFSRLEDGRIAQRAFGGHSHKRTCYAADKTGHAILHELVNNLRRFGVTIYEEWYVMELILEGKEVKGVVMFNIGDGRLETVSAKAIMFATGGYGRVFNTTSNDYASTGDGLAMSAIASLPLEDMEFVQFHPTGLYPVGVLISEAVRGEGAYLRNSEGERFMARYAPNQMELAPRDITSRAIVMEIRAGRGINPDGSSGGIYVHLDLTHMGKEKIMSRVPFCWEEAHRLVGVDAVTQPMPVRPTAHYCMGGIPVNTDGRVRLNGEELTEGFFAAGECACVSVHGANRLGSNSLLECVVYGRRVGRAIASYVSNRNLPDIDEKKYLAEAEKRIKDLLNQKGNIRINSLRQEFQDCMTEHCGVFRTEEVMGEGLSRIQNLKAKYSQIYLDDKSRYWNQELIEALELQNIMIVGEIILTSAFHRQESRGAHSREDFPSRNDQQYLQHTLAYYSSRGVKIDYMPVVINMFEPKERKY
ncbi:succinate dehydrogenase/fumarate reductase flavoprotein subunit [Cyanobacterium aponinum UTEX 3222]|uniref:Succinate dehydrogenase flavoprotein subunit n=1 Tax=Cyanobacterium aponinum AL20115 TaxID=3090662 RepID=A0AAF1C4U4_9CHRO|nr:succinate dehydrogenase/fumarate reductase flavoprotein subunit [Cyanobacterium aponinum]WPF87791.1 succinate dehydrogenase/fumarate reductase flavoprotein subunit [Cyanobacterium aponinum AL20115]WRL36860.1 succinate dehydrogenase/fumarate reductase flavoprotein subunit [Cyanobacterium aponinum UTEX 3221]WRL43189.1 succinate dehydrogenase/fumarate reductase flavoprotein subunit [Cyanobacterium aponinum UTEX 3222]